jgi:hypothetical protein
MLIRYDSNDLNIKKEYVYDYNAVYVFRYLAISNDVWAKIKASFIAIDYCIDFFGSNLEFRWGLEINNNSGGYFFAYPNVVVKRFDMLSNICIKNIEILLNDLKLLDSVYFVGMLVNNALVSIEMIRSNQLCELYSLWNQITTDIMITSNVNLEAMIKAYVPIKIEQYCSVWLTHSIFVQNQAINLFIFCMYNNETIFVNGNN